VIVEVDGQRLEVPDDATPDEIDALSRPEAPASPSAPTPARWSQKLGEGMPGFNRIVAGVQAATDPLLGRTGEWGEDFGTRFDEHLRAEQGQSAETQREHPVISTGLQAAGSLPLAAVVPGGAAPVGRAASALQGIKQGAGLGAAYAAGDTRSETPGGQLLDAATGGVVGGVLGGGFGAAMPAQTVPLSRVERDLAAQDYLYHVTPRENLKSISSEGLRPDAPKIGEGGPHGDTRAVFLGEADALPVYRDLYGDEAAALRVKRSDLGPLRPDEFTEGTGWMSARPVSARRLEVQGADGNWSPLKASRLDDIAAWLRTKAGERNIKAAGAIQSDITRSRKQLGPGGVNDGRAALTEIGAEMGEKGLVSSLSTPTKTFERAADLMDDAGTRMGELLAQADAAGAGAPDVARVLAQGRTILKTLRSDPNPGAQSAAQRFEDLIGAYDARLGGGSRRSVPIDRPELVPSSSGASSITAGPQAVRGVPISRPEMKPGGGVSSLEYRPSTSAPVPISRPEVARSGQWSVEQRSVPTTAVSFSDPRPTGSAWKPNPNEVASVNTTATAFPEATRPGTEWRPGPVEVRNVRTTAASFPDSTPVGFEGAHRLRRLLDDELYGLRGNRDPWSDKFKGALRDLRGAISGEIERSLDAATSNSATWKAANRDYQVASKALEFADKGMDRAVGNNQVTPYEMMALLGGVTGVGGATNNVAAGGLGGLATFLATRFARRHGSGIQGAAALKMSKLLQGSPSTEAVAGPVPSLAALRAGDPEALRAMADWIRSRGSVQLPAGAADEEEQASTQTPRARPRR
jgi:hypothetical protein